MYLQISQSVFIEWVVNSEAFFEEFFLCFFKFVFSLKNINKLVNIFCFWMYPIVFEGWFLAKEFILSLVFKPVLNFVNGKGDSFGHVFVVDAIGIGVLFKKMKEGYYKM